MSRITWTAAMAVLGVLAACGDKKSTGKDDAATGGSDSDVPPIDASPQATCTPVNGTTVSMRKIGAVSGGAILATSPPNDGRLFVIEQDGRIRIFENEVLKPTPFLDISNDIAAGGEQGLLGLAFHPQYAQNRYFYVFYTLSNANVLARYTTSASDPNVADPATGVVLLSIPDFAANHNGGMIEFGKDGYLYIGTGDGGGGGDPQRNGQNPNALLGKMLRIDVDHPSGGNMYGIPTDNPYASGGGAPEVFMIGLRNPWRWSFDTANGDMWIGDVGQNVDEELDYLPVGQQVGKNLGWSMYEATRCYGNYTCSPTGITFPQNIRNQAGTGWHAIIGGQVYRGSCYPDLVGYYFYSDNTQHGLARAKANTDATLTVVDLPGTWPASPSSLHADSRGELYMTTTNGSVYHLEAGP
jgi:glucose/arabinose dehydrogenase